MSPLRTVRDFHGTPELSYGLLSPAAYPTRSLLFCCLILPGADLAEHILPLPAPLSFLPVQELNWLREVLGEQD